MNKSFMQKIEKRIEEKFKTIKNLAYASGIDYQKLVNLRQRKSDPDLETLTILCNILDLDANELLEIKAPGNIIKELEIKNNELKKENEKLKKEVEDLKNKNLKLYEEITEINRDMRKYHTGFYEKKTR